MKQYDVVIVGGGFVGYTTALAFAHLNYKVALLEAKNRPIAQLENEDGRAIALAYTSCVLLKNLNVWPHVQATEIKQVHTSQQGGFGKMRISAEQLALDYLGQVVPAPMLGSALAQAVQLQENITEISPAQVTDINFNAESAIIQYDSENVHNSITAALIFGCDGASSGWREKFDLHTTTLDHQQHAMVANITAQRSHQNIAYERFTELGSLALLPLSQNRMTSVLTVENCEYNKLKNIDDGAYIKLIQKLFGKKLGQFSALGKRFAYPLQSLQCTQMQQDRFLLLGNAAHTVNPIAAQGLNLALRDIAVLTDCIFEAGLNSEALSLYTQKVLPEHERMQKFTQRLVKLAQPSKFKHLRSLGLFAADSCLPIKSDLAHMLTGLSAHRGRKLQAVQDAI